MGIRPSDLLNIKDELARFYFDRAIWMFCSAVESDLNQVENNTKKPRQIPQKKREVLNAWIPADPNAKGRFRDPAIGLIKKGSG